TGWSSGLRATRANRRAGVRARDRRRAFLDDRTHAKEHEMSEPLPDFDGLLDWPRLQEWIATQPGLPGAGPVTTVEQLTGGSQNNIFLLTRGAGGARMVLRRPPRHLRKNSNDTMLREARVLGAIAGSGVPHPEFFAVCADTDVIGVCFYVMGAIDGFTPMGQMPGSYGTDVEWLRALSYELVEGAARLGVVDSDAEGHSDD